MNKGLVFLAGWMLLASPVVARDVIPFSGTFDPLARHVRLDLGRGERAPVIVNVSYPQPDKYRVVVDIAHLTTPLCDISTIMTGDLTVLRASRGGLELAGDIHSEYTLLNYKPVPDLQLKFRVRDRQFDVERFQFGVLLVQGRIGLMSEKALDMVVGINSLELEDLLVIMQEHIRMKPLSLSGTCDGEIVLKGPFLHPDIQARISVVDGQMQGHAFETVFLDLTGTFPLVRLNDSVITGASGMSMKVSGALDLGDLAGLSTQISFLHREPIVKDSGARREWVFKRSRSSDDSSTDMTLFQMINDRGESSAVLGVQRSVGF